MGLTKRDLEEINEGLRRRVAELTAYVPEPPHWLDERTRVPGQSP